MLQGADARYAGQVLDFLITAAQVAFPVAVVVFAVSAALHAVLSKSEVRSTIGWVGLILLVPLVGSILYVLLGINRIQRKAVKLRPASSPAQPGSSQFAVQPDELWRYLPAECTHAADLARVVGCSTDRPLVRGNRLQPLIDGDQAYPAMLAAIDEARQSITLVTYLFDIDEAGMQFVGALTRAVERNVEVRVLVDAVGVRYSPRPAPALLRSRGVQAAAFMPAYIPWLAPFVNLRTHRKSMVVDGQIAFTGGMNIRGGHVLGTPGPDKVRDVHFKVEGPVVAQIQEVFAEDWQFTTGETLEGTRWFPPLQPAGDTVARGIADGPDADMGQLQWTFQGAIACATRSIRITTPYFLPEQTIDAALETAAMRGIQVDLLIPERTNITLVHWGMKAHMGKLIDKGVRVWLVPPPFDHSKLMVVDGWWTLLGSGNWDVRSLRLNWELQVEAYDPHLGARLAALIDKRIAASRRLTAEALDARPLPIRLRDGIARLGLPYL